MSVRTRARWSRVTAVLAVLALLGAVATTVGRSVRSVPGLASDTWFMITTFSDFGVLGYVAAVLLATVSLALRARVLPALTMIISVVLAAVHLSWIVPGYVADGDSAVGTGRLRVVAQNAFFGLADADAVMASAAEADVLVLVEFTDPAATAFARAGVERRFPYASGGELPGYGASGTRVYSRFPLREGRPLDPNAEDAATWRVEVEVPDLGPVTLVAAHPPRPRFGGGDWLPAQERLRDLLPTTRTVLAGDLNAVDNHPVPRELRRAGFRDADGIVGAGWTPTFPARDQIPPVIGIDHVFLSSDLTATAFARAAVPRTDHLGVSATVALRGPG